MSFTPRPYRTPRGTRVNVNELTDNDDKVLGKQTMRRREKTAPVDHFDSRLFKTINSAWTPKVNKASNKQIYIERTELVYNWFDMWTDSQRKHFLQRLLEKCERTQLFYVREWFEERVPIQRVDFTRVLPRSLSLKIFNYLDPRSLSRASEVSWNWKFLTEQDQLWIPRCKRMGWFLPYATSENEYGSWKKHYIACTLSMVIYAPRRPREEYALDTTEKQDKVAKMTRQSVTHLSLEQSRSIMTNRPLWTRPDGHPHDLDKSREALFSGFNPNNPKEPLSARLLHNQYGQVDRRKAELLPLTSSYGLELEDKKAQQIPERKRGDSLSTTLQILRFEESQYNRLIDMPWEFSKKLIIDERLRPGLSSPFPLPWQRLVPSNITQLTGLISNYPGFAHPRVIFISSRVPASELLVDAVMFGVIPIVYEYEGTVLSTLLFRLERALQGRQAQSIGFFGDFKRDNELRLVRDRSLNLADLDQGEVRSFVEALAYHTLPVELAGHVDLFVPFAAYGEGTELLFQLNLLTSMNFTAPASILGHYTYITSEWSASPEGLLPPYAYFESHKLAAWCRSACLVEDAVAMTKRVLGGYFDQSKVDLVKQLTGQIIFDALGQSDVAGVQKLADHILAGLIELHNRTNVDPTKFLAEYLLRESRAIESPSLRTGEAHDNVLADTTDGDRPTTNIAPSSTVVSIQDAEKSDLGKDITPLGQTTGKNLHDEESPESPSHETRHRESGLESLRLRRSHKTGLIGSIGPMHLTSDIFFDHPNKHAAVAQELLANEVSYLRSLEVLRDCYVDPLNRALSSNRTILSAHNVQTVFGDAMVLLEMSRTLASDLRLRLQDWSPHQSLGDVYLRFSGRLKAYSNYYHNYPLAFRIVNQNVESNPGFRAFLDRREHQPETKMMSLHDLLLLPTNRMSEYVTLLTWFLSHMDIEHADATDIREAIRIFGEMDKRVQDERNRYQQDRELSRVQALILGSPVLVEKNRYFIQQEDVALLQPPASEKIDPQYRVYQHVEDCGLFLFNDSLIITRRTTRHFPYETAREFVYTFQSCVELHRLIIYDIPDSKFIKNAIIVQTQRKKWVFRCVSFDTKQRFSSSMSRAINDALDSME